jgi:hypothetical protein
MLINYHFGIALVTNLLLLTAVSLLRVALLRIAALLRISTLLGISTLPTLLSCDTDIGQHSLVLIILHTTRQRPCLAPTGDLHPLLTCRSVVSGLNTKAAGIVCGSSIGIHKTWRCRLRNEVEWNDIQHRLQLEICYDGRAGD